MVHTHRLPIESSTPTTMDYNPGFEEIPKAIFVLDFISS